jgi:hypothetical protein
MFLPTVFTVEEHDWFLILSIVAPPFYPDGRASQVIFMVVLGRTWSTQYKFY